MSNKLKLLTGNYFNMSQYAALAKWAIIAALVSAVGYFAVDHYNAYTDLQKTVEDQVQLIKKKQGTIDTLLGDNRIKDDVIKTMKDSAKVAEQAAEKDKADKEAQKALAESIDKKRQADETHVRANKPTYVKQQRGSKEPPVLDTRNLETKISDIRITSIYSNYCTSANVKDAENCAGFLTELKTKS